MIEPRIRDLRVVDLQSRKESQSFQISQPLIGDIRLLQEQFAETGDSLDRLYSGV